MHTANASVATQLSASNKACTAWALPWLHPETCGSLNCNAKCSWANLWSEVNLCTFDISIASWSRGLCGNTNDPLLSFRSVWQKHLPSYYHSKKRAVGLSPVTVHLSIMIQDTILRGQSHVYFFYLICLAHCTACQAETDSPEMQHDCRMSFYFRHY